MNEPKPHPKARDKELRDRVKRLQQSLDAEAKRADKDRQAAARRRTQVRPNTQDSN